MGKKMPLLLGRPDKSQQQSLLLVGQKAAGMIYFLPGLDAMLRLTAGLNLESFSPDYSRGRQRMLEVCSSIPEDLVQDRQAHTHPLSGPTGEPLACDVTLIGQSPRPRNLLVLVSGTHGVEGFAGSAIQVDCLPLLVETVSEHASLGVAVIHAFNPWGFAWLRRSDHEGIDLNRNFVDFSNPLPDNKEYEVLHPRIMALAPGGLDNAKPPWQETGVEAFAEVFTRGQYRHADGCFYGGRAPSWSRKMLQQVTTDEMFAGADRVAVVDLHTGLGPYGYGELINDHEPGTAGDEWVRRWYGANAKSVLGGESVSTMKEGLLDFFWHSLIGDRGCFVTLEFGTYSMDRLIHSLIAEQQYHNSIQREGKARDLASPYVQELKKFFYPEEPSWQQQVLFRGRQVVSLACKGMLSG